MSDQWIRASEIGNYMYCRRSWWLQRARGKAPANVRRRAAGAGFHGAHGRLVRRATRSRRLAYGLILVTVSLILVTLALNLGP